ncbi:hypothetical protein [Palleronia sp.]|uniref:hypothetical protein n=1 Tax=Palleronia sp. TaxID=1940284 RepID=UPI0035C7DA8C
MTGWFRDVGAREGDEFEISRAENSSEYGIGLRQRSRGNETENDEVVRIKLTGWRKVH